ncbi:hypothetical protein [Varibaculum prostatecancerukia]|uniref:hypothetical protein n=1 Tax=Varibaculum prostatecancerukia TaxID=2811781 RepID=UPI001C002B8A|nr:hypothetical protein [Varibaculum prostatecancerukia]
MRDIRSEFIRFWSMREAFLAMIPVLLLSIVFSIINGEIMNAILSGDLSGHDLDPSLAQKPISDLLLEGYLGPVYQASVIFIPIAAAYLFNLEYAHGEHESVLLVSRSLLMRRIGTILCGISWAVGAAFVAAIANYVVCVLQLDLKDEASLSILSAFIVFTRVAVFAILFSVLALFVTALTRRLFVSVIVFVLLLFISLSGILQSIPILHNSLPLIGGKSFAFWDPAEGPYSISGAVVLLLSWIAVSLVGYIALAVGRRR